MKIALLTDGIYPYVIGGMQKHSYYLAKYLAAAGHRVDLYHVNRSEYDIRKLEFFSEEEKRLIRSYVVSFPHLGRTPGHYIRESYEYSRRVLKLFKEHSADADFVYVKGFAGWELLHQKSKGFKTPPVGLNFHGYEMFQPQPSFVSWLQSRFLLRGPVKYNVQHADFLFSYGSRISEIIRSLGVAEKRIIEIPTGIEKAWLNETPAPSGKTRKLIFVGRYERRKGIQELNAALKLLLRKDIDFEFHFVGPIPEKKKIKSTRIIYHGAVSDPEQMKKLLRASEILVCPSHSEGMPNVIMEGLASGCAIIGTDVGAVSLMVTPQTGKLIPPGNSEALRAALLETITLPAAQLDAFRQQAVGRVRSHFLWETIIRDTVEKIQARI